MPFLSEVVCTFDAVLYVVRGARRGVRLGVDGPAHVDIVYADL